MGNYPKCYNQVNDREYPSVLKDPRVFWVANRTFRQASVKTRSANDNEMDLIRREIEIIKKIRDLPIDDQGKMFAELEELEMLRGNEDILKERRKEENQDSTEDEDEDVLEKRRIEDASKYSVLSYHVGSVSGDKLMKKLRGNYQISEDGDDLMKNLGVTND